MNAGQQRRLQQRWLLEQRSAELRDRLATHTEAISPLFAWADRARRGAHWVRRHPLVPLAVALLLLWRRPRRVVRWGSRLWALWGTVQRVRGVWQAWRGASARR